MSRESTVDYRQMRRKAIVHMLSIPIAVYFVKMTVENIFERAASRTEFAAIMDTMMNMLHFVAGGGLILGFLILLWCQVNIAQESQSPRSSRASRSTSGASTTSDEDAPSVLETINAILPNLTFGTYRRVEDVDVSSGSTCADCSEDATIAREYTDSTVRFGLAVGATDAETVAYCTSCAKSDDAIQEGWVPDASSP